MDPAPPCGMLMAMNRLERVRERIDWSLHRVEDPEERRCGFVHLYGVSATAAFLAFRRSENAELAAIAGMLHDLVSYETGDPEEHAVRGAQRAFGLLHEMGTFSDGEIGIICSAIARHSDKGSVDEPMDELLKDADVLQHCLYDPDLPLQAAHASRREALACEFGPLAFSGEA
jgi:HD superfamily phosphodiesterase